MENTSKNTYKNSEEQLKEKLINLKKIIEILDSSLSDNEKIYQIYQIYNTPEKFRKAFGLIKKFGKNDPMFRDFIPRLDEIYTKLLEFYNNGLYNYAKEYTLNKTYIDNYPFALKVIEYYLESEYKNDSTLCLEMGIDINTFNSCVETIEKLNPSLFSKYKEKKKKQKYYANIYTFKNIAFGIRTGHLYDGTPFDLLKFWELVPFKYSKGIKKDFDEFKEINSNIYFRSNNFFGQVEVFTKATMPEESKTILGYMKKNKIYNYRYVSEHQIRKMYSGMVITINDIYGVPTNIYSPEEVFEKIKDINEEKIVGRQTFTKEDVEIVLEYMKLNNLPSLIEVFKLVQDKYLKGEINIEDERRKNKAKILRIKCHN